MSEYSVINYNQQRIMYNPAITQINSLKSNTNFRGSIPANYPPDTVEISVGDKIKKDTGISTGMKWLIGAAGIAATAFISHKFIHPKIVQQRVQKIFLEDFSKEEAAAIQKKYKDILKTKDKDAFIDKMFTELKKDYRLDNIPTKLDKEFKAGTEFDAIKAAAHFDPKYERGYFLVGIDKSFNNKELFKHMTHELRHAKQNVLGYQSVNKEEFLSICRDRLKDTFKGEKECTKEWLDEASQQCWQERFDFYSKLGIKSIDKSNKNYEWARKVMESMRTYANKTKENYNTAFYETDAKSTENLMWKMVNNRFF